MAVESLGRLALTTKAWHEGLNKCGAVEVLSTQIRGWYGNRRLLKYCFWAAAALRGLPFVVAELQAHLQSAPMVDAAFCTVIDILDDDLEGEWILTGTQRCTEADVP